MGYEFVRISKNNKKIMFLLYLFKNVSCVVRINNINKYPIYGTLGHY